MATYTSTLFVRPAKSVHVGLNNIQVAYTFTSAASVGDVVWLAKIPNGARVVDFIEDHSSPGTAVAFGLGVARGAPGADFSLYASSLSADVKNRHAGEGFPASISLSASDPNDHGILIAQVTDGSMTNSVKISVSFTYRVDE